MSAELIVRTSLLLALVWLTIRLLPRAAAATRHLLWHGAIIAVLLAPLVEPLLPKISVVGSWGLPQDRVVETLQAVQPAPVVPSPFDSAQGAPSVSRGAAPSTPSYPSAPSLAARSVTAPLLFTAPPVLVALYFLAGWLIAAHHARRATPAPPAWLTILNDLRERCGIVQEVRLGISDRVSGPVATGVWRASILLPCTSMFWDAERVRSVLLHELAHIRRRDCQIQLVAQAACALYWFNPLVWMAAAALRRERERACDDDVLRFGARPSAYAAMLLDIARDVRPSLRPSSALAMARPSELEGRLLAVLAAHRARVPARFTRAAVALVLLAVTAVSLSATPFAQPTVDRPSVVARMMVVDATAPDSAAQDPTIAALVRALDDPAAGVRERAARGLAMMSGPEVIDPLLVALTDRDPQVREKAAMGLALRGDPRVIAPLIAAMRDADAQVREKAAMALGTTGDPRALPVIERALEDPDAQVREKAIDALLVLRKFGR